MTLLLVTPVPQSIPEQALERLSEHFKRRWTGTFILGLGPFAPGCFLSNEQFDWMSWPLGQGKKFTDDVQLLEKILKRFEVQAVLGLGIQSSPLVQKLRQGMVLCFDPDADGRLVDLAPVLNFYPGSQDHALGLLDDWLVDRVAMDVLVAGEDDWTRLLPGLENHAGANRARLLRVRWSAKPSARTIEFMDLLRRHELFSRMAMELELSSSELFQVRRSAMTHTPADFLMNPSAWRQFVSFVSLLLRLHPDVEVRVRTVSSKKWIRSSVELTNSVSIVARKALKLWRWW